ncbi:glycogen/starch/alpha-glucan phosphorylases family protein, partial [Vibrio cholerae CP1035(8)]
SRQHGRNHHSSGGCV